MNRRCLAQTVVAVTAVVAWLVVVWLMVFPPGPDATMRLPYFAVLGVAIGASSLALFPLVMRDYLKDMALAYFAGYHQREQDEADRERDRLRLVR